MASRLHSLLFFLPILHLLLICSASDQGPRPYIVYMGGSRSRSVDAIEDIKLAESAHLQLLSTIIQREERTRITLGHVYHHAFRGFSAMLTHKEASLLSGHDEIVSVFPDSNFELHTTRSWNFLEEESQMQSSRHHYHHHVPPTTTDVIIGMIDTATTNILEPGSQRWKGVCMEGSDFKKSFDSGAFPFIQLGETDGFQVLKYANSTRNPTATILATATVSGIKPAPNVADFSSRGPGELTENILKPDIMAPGVAILAANIPESEAGHDPIGKKPSKFVVQSGTSMACPHVSGAAAFIRSVHSSRHHSPR